MTQTHTASPGETRVYFTYCHLLHAGNVDHELGWVAEELAQHDARLSYFLSRPEPDFYPHYTHGLDSLFRFGGCIPAIHAKADLADTVLLGLQWFWEGGGMLVRADDRIRCMEDLAGRRVGLSRSLNAAKVDYRRVTEERGTELLLRLHGMRRDDLGSSTVRSPTTGTKGPAWRSRCRTSRTSGERTACRPTCRSARCSRNSRPA